MDASEDPSTVDLDSVDLMAPRWHRDGPPHRLFARMRSECPMHGGVGPDGVRYWSVTRDEDVVAVSRDPGTFSSYRSGILLPPDQLVPLQLQRESMVFKDPPDHQKYRKIVASVFTARAVAAMEPVVRARAVDVIDRIGHQGHAELVADVATPFALTVLTGLLGVPDEDVELLHRWTLQIEAAQRSDVPAEATGTFAEIVKYLQAEINGQVAEGRNSLVTRLHYADVDGHRLTPDELLQAFTLLMFAGNDTTRNTITTGVLALLRHEQWEVLRDNLSILPQAVEEILRWTSVIKYFVRTATRPTTIAGQSIAEGEKLVTWFGSAGRDPALNHDADHFDITRARLFHRSFGGGGPHLCVGNQLARLELQVLIGELARRLPDLALSDAPTYVVSNWVHAVDKLAVQFTPMTFPG